MQVPPPCHLAPPPPLLDPGREESCRRLTKGPTSWRCSPGNKWRASLGGSDSETAMAWRPAVTHSTSMGELSVEAENTKALFFPSFLFFLSFFFALSLAALRNTRAAWKHVFLIIGSGCRLEDWGKTRPKTEREGEWRWLKQALSFTAPKSQSPSPATPISPRTSGMADHRIVDLGENLEYVSSNIFIYR